MDNSTVPNIGHDIENNDHSPDIPNLVTDIIHSSSTSIMDSNRQPPMTPEAQQEFVDMLMTVEEDDDMPSLYEASFTESDDENNAPYANVGAQAEQIQQSSQDNVVLSPSSSFSIPAPLSSSASNSMPQPHRSNRRARVDDDDDEDRDRRHPSQRVGSHSDQPSSSNTAPYPFFGPFFTPFRDAGAALGLGTGFFNRTSTPNAPENGATSNTTSSDRSTNLTPGVPVPSSQSQDQGPPQNANGTTNRHPPVHFLDYEFSIVMDGSGRPQPVRTRAPPSNEPNVQQQPGGNPPTATPSGPTGAGNTGLPPGISFNPPIPFGNLATLLGIPFPLPGGGFGFPQMPEEKEDPERARKLVDGLDEVPVGLVRRLERVGTGGGGMGEEESKGGDVGCAICWDRLLGAEEDEVNEPTENPGGSSMVVDEETVESTMERKAKIVSLPCAHVFHADCLIPWFSRPRRTTCPTCRFNIDPDNLTYVSARQRRREQRGDANNNATQPTPGDGPTNPGLMPAAAATTDTDDQPPQQGGIPVELGGGLASILRMMNAQGQPPQHQHPPAAAPVDDTAPSGTQPQVHGPPPLIMPMPMPVGNAGNLFPAFAGQMQMPLPFMAVPFPPANAEGVPMPMPMPWMMTDPVHLATGGGNRTNANSTDTLDGVPVANDANASSATAVNEPPPLNGTANSPPLAQPPHRPPTIIADVVRISVDMVFDGRPRRRTDQGPTNNAASRSTNPSQDAQNATQEQATDGDTDDDHDSDEGPPTLLSPEEQAEEREHISEFLNQFRHNRHNHNGNGPDPAANGPSEQPTSQPADHHPQHRDPHGFPMTLGGIHVAGTGRSLEEAFNQAFTRLQSQMTQPRQEGQNPQRPSNAPADENAPPPQHTQAEPQAQGQRPWQFMSFMDFGGIPMQSEGPKRPWAPPPPPGPTLRQRIERREREAGLRCHDVSCGLGPSDEDPHEDDSNGPRHTILQLSILRNEGDEKKAVCEHKFHSSCLVSAERVALRGAEAVTNEGGDVDVSCSVCRATGCVMKEQWDEGVRALQ